VRTCVGCRERAERAGVLRVVAVAGALVPDPRRVLPGRGASVHLDRRCLDLAERRGAFPRALRVTGRLDPSAVHAALDQHEGQAQEQDPHDQD